MFESGETGQLVDQLRITGRSLVSGAGEGGVSLQSLRNLAITMGDIAIAGLQLGAALSPAPRRKARRSPYGSECRC